MAISFSKALQAPFSDERWAVKLGIAYLLYLPSILAVMTLGIDDWSARLLSALAGFLLSGYGYIVLHNEIHDEFPLLPEWDFAKVAITWCKLFVISLGYFLILFISVFILGAISAVSPILAIPAILLLFAFITLFLIFFPIAQCKFAKNYEINEAFDFNEIYKLFRKGWTDYLTALFYIFVITMIFAIPLFILGIIMNVILMDSGYIAIAAIWIFPTIASMNLYGQAYKSTISKAEAIHPIDV